MSSSPRSDSSNNGNIPPFTYEKLESPSVYDESGSPELPITFGQPLTSVDTVIAPVSQNRTRCQYCDELVPSELFIEHRENCDKRKIVCEACGESVMLDIFDFHLETCSAKVDPLDVYHTNTYYSGLYQHHLYQPDLYEEEGSQGNENHHANGLHLYPGGNHDNENENEDEANESWREDENPEEDPDAEPGSYDDEMEGGIDLNTLTYEQLIALDNTIVKKGMNAEEMKQFPIEIHYKDASSVCNCSICISELESGEVIRKLGCKHVFHKGCIDTWLESNITCPVCKKYLR
jgi:hypothetical protein